MRGFVRGFSLTVGILALSASSPAIAQDLTRANCATYTATTLEATPLRGTIEQWILGYVAGFRAARGDRSLSELEARGLLHNLAGYCGNKPLTRLDVAAAMAASSAR